MNKQFHKIILSACIIFSINSYAKDENDSEELEAIEVIKQSEDNKVNVQLLPEQAQGIIDTADVLKKIPGANVNRNGPLTGIAQYRGLFGNRVNIQIDGIKMQEAGPNSMDPAMSHVPAGLVDAVVLNRGIAPVSSGIETIGGNISVLTKNVEGKSQDFQFHGDASVGYQSVNSGLSSSVFASAESKNHDFYLGIDTENGDSYEFADGENFNTEYQRDYYLMGYNFRGANHALSFNINYNDTGKTGTPSLPMDIVYVRGGVATIEDKYSFSNDWQLKSHFSHQGTDHLMNNFIFRNRNSIDKRQSLAHVDSNSYGFVLDTHLQSGKKLLLGFEGDSAANRADITNPDNALFFITNFDTQKDRNSIFIELENDINDFTLTSGLRFTHVTTDADEVSSTVAMMQNTIGNLHRILRDRFNAADRSKTDNNFDASFNLDQTINQNLTLTYGVAYKTRSPSHQERYLWLPLEATAGMADGLQYFGNLNLQPEHAMQFEFGANFDNGKFKISPHLFYHQINDYIQGTPTTSTPAPPNTLTFNNVDAKLYGADLDFSYQINENLAINNTTSYVRGKRRDISDNLYRIAPLNTRLQVVYSQNKWRLSSELVAYKAQNDVSVTNKEQKTPGYALTNIAATYSFNKTINFATGINNVFDKKYANHLNGYNRNNLNSDVGFDPNNLQAFRLPGEGINLYASIYLHW